MKTTIKQKTKNGLNLLLCSALIGSLSFTSCKKEEGPVGPAGPAGPAGANGTNGNSNVKSQTSTNLTWTFNSATLVFETNISTPAITQDIVDKGAVFVYLQDGSTSSQLPTSGMYDAATIVFFDFEYSVGNVKVTFANSDTDNSIVPQSTIKFKIVAMSASAKEQYIRDNKISEGSIVKAVNKD